MKGFLIFCLLLPLIFFTACHRSHAVFTNLGAAQTGISFTNKPLQKKLFGILYYLYYYNGGGVATGDVNGDGLPDIYFTANNKGGNKLYLNKGNFKFEDITAKAGVAGTADWCTGVTMADVNGDGRLDIYVCAVANAHGLQGRNQLYINNGNGTFTESAKQYGLDFSGFSAQAAFFDYDRDGDLDLFLVNQSHKPNENIVDTSNRRIKDPNSGDRLFRNDGHGDLKKFTDVSAQAGVLQSSLGYGLGLSVADFNNDGWDDVYVGNDFHENDYYYINNGNGTFTESGAQHFAHYSRFSMGNDAGDYNNDGQMDLVTVDMLPQDEKVLKTYGSDENADTYKQKLVRNGFQYQYSRNALQKNNGGGETFSEVGLQAGIAATDWSWSPLFADFDNDGKKDLLITSGIVKRPVDLDYVKFVSDLYVHKTLNTSDKLDDEALQKMPDGASHPFFYKGNGTAFTDVSEAWGTAGMKGYFNGAAYADFDGDGNLDVVMNCIDAPAVILKNNAPKKNTLTIKFNGAGGNTSGIGAKAWVFAKDSFQYAELQTTHGFQSGCPPQLHFGLGAAQTADSILIVWPSQRYEILNNSVQENIVVDEKNARDSFVYTKFFKPPYQPLTFANLPLAWQHQENDFDDFNAQYLIPHGQSTRGPKLAVADVNGDGLDDFYACGAKGQAGALQLQQRNGRFTASDTALFAADKASEDVDAIFLDVNGDGAKDLYVATGGNEAAGNDPALLDKLYINNGHGLFKKFDVPPIFRNNSCVAAADVDGDGDADLFVGVLADAHAYGVPQTSYLLLNNGHGAFSVAQKSTINLQNLGVVTTATFADVDKNGTPDLLVAGEFMPISIFKNSGGTFTKTEVPNSSGWWQTLFVDDINGDGNMDVLAGNWGLNNKFSDGENAPVKLYVKDFDKNGQADQLLSYTHGGKEFPFLAKDEMERALPVLRKHYLLYADYAGLEMKDAFYGFAEQVTPLQAQRLASAVLWGNGSGGFTVQNLPAALQQAPVFSFLKVKANLFIAGGNFYNVIPYEGRYDAQAAALFSVAENKNVSVFPQQHISSLRGEVRDIKWLHAGKDSLLVVARNNDSLLFFRKTN